MQAERDAVSEAAAWLVRLMDQSIWPRQTGEAWFDLIGHLRAARPLLAARPATPGGDAAGLAAEVERLRALVDRLRADLKLAAEYAGATTCEGCGAAIFDCEDGKHTGDVHGCIPFVHDGMPGECWRYRTVEGMDRAWPACALAATQPSDAENDRLRARLGDANPLLGETEGGGDGLA